MDLIVSVVIPIYNVEAYLKRCVDSILNQTYKNFQLILVDDGSPDNCPDICDEYAKKDSRVHVVHRENGGLSAARNSGIDWIINNSPTEWITFIDSDDWIHPQYLELLLRAAYETDSGVIVSDFCLTDSFVSIYNELSFDYEVYKTDDFFVNNEMHPISACGRLFKTEDFQNTRFPEGRIHEDRFTTYKILFKYETITFLNQNMYYCYQNENSLTRTEWNPKRLDDVFAAEQQLDYFKSNDNLNVYLFVLKEYFNLLLYSLKHSAKENRYQKYHLNLKWKMRRFLMFNSSRVKLNSQEKTTAFKYSYPILFKVLRRINIVKENGENYGN